MNVRFHSPPIDLQKGGIQNAIEGLRGSLLRAGVSVRDGGGLADERSVHHFHGLWNLPNSLAGFRLRKNKLRYVVSPHGMLEPWAFCNRWWKKISYFKLLERRFLLGAQSLFVTSQMEREHLSQRVSHPRVETLPLGCYDPKGPGYFKARRVLGWAPDERVMLFLSRLDPKKGLHLLLDALVQIPEIREGWRLLVVGDGPSDYVRLLKSQERSLGEKLLKIDWIGPVWGGSRWNYLQGADLFVLPTHSENFGIAVLESLHAGTPVLTTVGTPWREHSEKDGLFICKPTTDSIRECLSAALTVAGRKWPNSKREQLSEWANSSYSWDILSAAYIKAYRRALGDSEPECNA